MPENSYSLAQSEWNNGSRSDVLYASNSENPPIIIESQYYVDQELMLRLISYSINEYRRYKVLPIFLVIITKSFDKATFEKGFLATNQSLLLEATCNFWAKRCFLLPVSSISNFRFNDQKTLDPMLCLGFFTTHHTLKEIPRPCCDDPTLILISSIANKILSKESDEMITKSSTTYLIEQIKGNLEDIVKDDQENNTNDKLKRHALEGLLSLEKLKNDMGSSNQTTSEQHSDTVNACTARYNLMAKEEFIKTFKMFHIELTLENLDYLKSVKYSKNIPEKKYLLETFQRLHSELHASVPFKDVVFAYGSIQEDYRTSSTTVEDLDAIANNKLDERSLAFTKKVKRSLQ